MLVKKEDRIEIWSEGWNKRYTILVALLGIFAIIFAIIGIIGCLSGNVAKGLVMAIVMPAFCIFLSVNLYFAEKEKFLIVAVDEKYIEIYNVNTYEHEMVKKIPLEQIDKVDIVRYYNRYSGGISAEIYYGDGNGEKKYSFRISNKDWLKTALREYMKNLVIEDKTTVIGIRVK